MTITRNIILEGKHQKSILTDVFYNANGEQKPVVVFCHGYKGFKDWGAWDLMAKAFANSGFFFVKFNFSHNGGTAQQPIDFPDLEAFGNNNYTKELDDLTSVIDWIFENNTYSKEVDLKNINLIGHSRGGGIVTIKAEGDNRISKVISLAGVSDYGSRYPMNTDIAQWKKDGVVYVVNGRTKQQMPHFYQFYEDFIQNGQHLTIERAVSNLKIPFLIIHGDKDSSVSIDEAYNLRKWNPNSQLEIIKGADHVFNTKHPWKQDSISEELDKVVLIIKDFIS